MERHHILIEDTDGTDVCFMGYTHANAGRDTVVKPEEWWQTAWRMLNMDIFKFWRLYGPKGIRRG